jgi:hypothetical protein
MMYAIHITLPVATMMKASAMSATFPLVLERFHANSNEFLAEIAKQGFQSPEGSAQASVVGNVVLESRFRVFLTVPNRPEIRGVYYVTEWSSRGLVSICLDKEQGFVVPRRREAVLARRKECK